MSLDPRLLLLGGFMRHRTLMRLGRLAMHGMLVDEQIPRMAIAVDDLGSKHC